MALENKLTRIFETTIKKWITETLNNIMKEKLEAYINDFFQKGKADRKVNAYIDKQLTKNYWFKGTKTVQDFCDKEAKQYLDKFGDKMEEYLNTEEGMAQMLSEISEQVLRYHIGM